MFQCVRLSISSSVIMFHRERKECGPENGKNGGRSRNNAPKPESGKKGEAYGQPQPIEEKRQGRHGKRRQTARTARKRQRKNCNMQSWERAAFVPVRHVILGTGSGFPLSDSFLTEVEHGQSLPEHEIPLPIFLFLTCTYAS